ncbi:hypothetical protein [Ralstonia pseudosolanacearum]|uniref:MarR family transcriptional regulator n=1 Tax=Ralstonia solanacearum TaxID=305 RepID=A0ABY6NGC0_RALSL|nr:hypothetical protein LH706_06775 [Ralstonia solanacearum]
MSVDIERENLILIGDIMNTGVVMAESYDDDSGVERASREDIVRFRRNLCLVKLEDDERAIMSYFCKLAEFDEIIKKDQREIGLAVNLQQHRVSLAVSSLAKKGIITKNKKGKYNCYMLNLGFELPVKNGGLVVPFRRKRPEGGKIEA